MARLPGRVGSEEPDREWQDLCEALLPLAYSHFVECGILRERVKELEKRIREAEEERDTSDRIAEDLYQFFSRTARRVANAKRVFGGAGVGEQTNDGSPRQRSATTRKGFGEGGV